MRTESATRGTPFLLPSSLFSEGTAVLRCSPRMNSPEPKYPTLSVGEFYTRHSEALQMSLLGEACGFDRRIREPTINRPGLALSGFYSYFAEKRMQVLGAAELSYLKSLPEDDARARCKTLCGRAIPGIVIARGTKP